MSSCLILQDKHNYYIGADTACSVNVDGKYYRYSDNIEKIFIHGNDTYFCSGNVSIVNFVNAWINIEFREQSEINIESLSDFLKHYCPQPSKDAFDIEVVICRKENDTSKIYQLSQYNKYNPVVFNPRENGINIICCGYKTQDVYSIARQTLLEGCTDIKSLYQNIFSFISDNKVGGNLTLYTNGKKILHTKIQEKDIEYTLNISDYHLLIAEMVLSGVVESSSIIGSDITGGTIRIGEQSDGRYAFEVHADGTVTMGGGSSIGGFTGEDLSNMSNSINNTQNSIQSIQGAVDTINSQKMYRVEVQCSGSMIMQKRNQTATLSCKVYSWDADITNTLDSSLFNWIRVSNDESQDAIWNENAQHKGRKTLTITTEDITNNANFYCEVSLPE